MVPYMKIHQCVCVYYFGIDVMYKYKILPQIYLFMARGLVLLIA